MTVSYSLSQFELAVSSLSKDCRTGFIPTMGALHQGHISLVKTALKYTDKIIVSIFVNPTQFNNPEDLERYPRSIEADCRALEEAGVSLVFIPSVDDIYPQPDTRTFDLEGLDLYGEGPRRPGHFNGVVQVVTRLFDIVKPDYAFFGEKDFQQLAIIRRMTAKLGYNIEIIGCPTFREPDGLAMSSRNMLLTKQHRASAPNIYKALSKGERIFKESSGDPDVSGVSYSPAELSSIVALEINSDPLLKTEYVEIINSLTLQVIPNWEDAENIRLCTAVYAGNIRLIDNIKLK